MYIHAYICTVLDVIASSIASIASILILFFKFNYSYVLYTQVIDEHLSRQANRNYLVFEDAKLNWIP